VPNANLLGLNPFQWIALIAALFTLMLLADALAGHYRRGFVHAVQYVPFVSGGALIVAALVEVAAPLAGSANLALRITGWLAVAAGLAGTGFHHYYGVIRKPGGYALLLNRLMYGAPPLAPLALAAMGGSATVRLVLDEVAVPASDVVSMTSFEEWQAQDRLATARPNPAAFGIAATCCRLLEARDAEVAESLGRELAECRERSYAMADDPGRADLTEMVDARAGSLELAVRSAEALVAAAGGRAMERTHPAQRLLREAAFFTIQAQTPASRSALLSRLAPSQPAPRS
jgi:hypothetical protein